MPSVLDAPGGKEPLQLAPAAPKPPAAPAAVTMRGFGDAPAARQMIFDNALKAVQGIQPITNQRHTLSLHDVDYADPAEVSHADWKNALLTRGTLARRLRGVWRLTDNTTGNVLAEKKSTLANIPYLTDSGTFVQRGNSITMAHQMRLSPGVFGRQKANSELEAHVNVLPGQGRSHRLFMDPATGVFKLNIGQANMPLYPVLRAMGVTDSQLRDAWGNDLTAVNMQKAEPQVLKKLYERIGKQRDPNADPMTIAGSVAQAFRDMKVDPEITKRTLGTAFGNVDEHLMLATTKKLLALNRREATPDDRDHLAYQHLMGPEDLLAERFGKDKQTLRKLLWRASAKGNLDHIGPGAMNTAVTAAMLGSGLASPLEEINPAEILDQQSRVTRMGEGGIASLESVPDESRSVQPSHLGFVDFLRTPESGKVGVDMRLARGARKGSDGRLYAPVRDLKSNQIVYRSPQDLADSVLAFPGEMDQDLPMVASLVNGKLRYMPRNRVHYELPHMEDAMSPLANMVPLKSMVKGQRAVMASRMLTQALPLVDGEAPLVQSGMPGSDDRSYEEEYATHMGAIKADAHAHVLTVAPDKITLRTAAGDTKAIQLHDNLPFNRKTFWHQTPAVKPGDHVAPGQLLARSNYTDARGVTALGKNLRVAYLPFRGLNFEDATVISESARHRLSSEHMYQHEQEWEPSHHRGKKAFVSIFPSAYPKKMLENFGDDGVVKKGTVLSFGDPLILAAKQKEVRHGQLHRGRGPSFSNDTTLWNHHVPGLVTDVVNSDKGAMVVVKSTHPMEIGDKLSGRYGDKGVIADIVPDDQMPTDREGRPYEILANPLGIISRTNPAQIVEAALGKVAEKTGKPYKLQDFSKEKDMLEFARQELSKHGLSDLEDVVDPETGRKISGVMTGNRFFMKLHHTSESKGQGRSIGSYTAEGTPAKGGEEGAKRVGMLDLGALLSHGATQVIRDVKLVRGQAHPEYWAQVMSGFSPPTPRIPHVYEKFVEQLRASGINPVRENTRMHIMALTDQNVADLTDGRELKSADTVDWRSGLKPVKGGLFDETLTGGHGGNRWSQITLHTPMPSPVMEEPIRRMLGLTEKKFRGILGGQEELNGHRGPEAIARALDKIDVSHELERARTEIRGGRGAARDMAVRKLGYLKSAEKLGLHPRDWMLSKMPVLPPAFRPVTTMGAKKLPLVADANYLYKELFDANQNLKAMHGQVEDLGDEHLGLYDTMKAVTGLGSPTHPKNQERGVKGVLKQIFGSSPKFGTVQRRLLSSTVDMVGRAVITPNPDLDMDQVGLPETKAWEIYKPFVVQHLVRRGMPRMQAALAAKDKSPGARQALVAEMGQRPVVINRAPVLHRYGMMAAWPKLTKGNTLQVSPLVVGGFNADFDGDAMQYHVPSTEEAAHEAAEKMLPSRNLFSAARFKVHYLPSQEYVGGLYNASSRINKQNKPRVFATRADAVRAYRRGDINVDQQIEILHG